MKTKIILLDDERIFLERYVEALILEGVCRDDIFDTTNPSQALGVLGKYSSEPLVFISDYELGNFTFGDEVIASVKQKYPKIPCILISRADIRDKARELDVLYWQKSRFHEELAEMVLRASNAIQK